MTIKAGDWVWIAKPSPCCNSYENVGKVFQVRAVPSLPPADFCSGCFEWGKPGEIYAYLYAAECNGHIAAYRLKKIPPLPDLEGQKDSSGLDERHEFYEALRKMAEGLRS